MTKVAFFEIIRNDTMGLQRLQRNLSKIYQSMVKWGLEWCG